jgi:hypothetical protein
METIKAGDFYQHSKSGKQYKIIAVGKHSETLEDLVVYEAQYDNPMSKIWVRPLNMFIERFKLTS